MTTGLGRRRRYFTGLLAVARDLRDHPRIITGAGWAATFRKTAATESIRPTQEVVLAAPSWLAAQRALNLIRAGLFLLHGEPLIVDADERLVAWNDSEPEVEDREIFSVGRGRLSVAHIPTACLLAARASRRRAWQYAITKYRFSVKLYGASLSDLDPGRRPRHLALSRFLDDHVAFSHAILAAYSAVEDLGLELRASRERPSRIGGNWNPVVKTDLEGRLHAAGVSTAPLLWTVRGAGTRVHRQRKVIVASRAPWAAGPMIRDGHVDLIDAIAYADWLRDKIAAHASKKLTPSLSPYDVVNVQHVARRLIMEVMGLGGRWWETPAPRRGRRRSSRDR